MRCNYYLRNPKAKSRTAIYMSVSYQGRRCIFYPGESIEVKSWVGKGINRPKQTPENNALIGRLNRFEQFVRDSYDELKKIHGVVRGTLLQSTVMERIRPSLEDDNKPMLIIDFFKVLIDDTRNRMRLSQGGKAITESTIVEYEATRKHFKNFQAKQKKEYRLNDINQKLADSFSDYLNIYLNMAFNGSGKYMKTFKTMMNYARQKKLIGLEIILDTKVKVTRESPDNPYLTEQEIEAIMDLKEFDSPLHEVVRDYLVIGCKSGLRYSDYSKINERRIDNGFINVMQKKVQARVTIPIHPLVERILAKYPNGKLPDCPCNQVFNRYLKDIGKKIPALNVDFEKTLTRARTPEQRVYKKWELLQSHTARRSFCTNEYLAGTPTTTIMAISGHKTEKSFMTYIKADSLQHAMVLRDKWKANGVGLSSEKD